MKPSHIPPRSLILRNIIQHFCFVGKQISRTTHPFMKSLVCIPSHISTIGSFTRTGFPEDGKSVPLSQGVPMAEALVGMLPNVSLSDLLNLRCISMKQTILEGSG